MAMKRWVKVLLAVGVASVLVFAAVVAGLGWMLVSYTRPGVEVGASMPAIELVTLQDGAAVDLDQYRGQVVVLDFWSSG